MTSLVPLSRRVQIFKDVLFTKVSGSNFWMTSTSLSIQLKLSVDGTSTDDLTYVGHFFGEATKHWSEREIAWSFSQLETHLQLKKKIDRFYSSEHGEIELVLSRTRDTPLLILLQSVSKLGSNSPFVRAFVSSISTPSDCTPIAAVC